MQENSLKETYRGVIVPMTTPFDRYGAIDPLGVKNIVTNLVDNGCAPFVACTTGESASISDAGKRELVGLAVESAAGKQLVYAGIADNCFESSLEKAQQYKELGADVAVSHLPCYYPIDEEQMRRYFIALADASPLPLVLYNIPVTTSLSIPVSLIDELSHHENIVGAKDSERGDERLRDSLALWSERADFTFHLGWAAMSSFGLQNGLDGIVPSSANLVPGLYRGIYDAAKRGDGEEADRLQAITDDISAFYQKDQPLSRAIPIFKAMLAAFKICEPYAASPMLTLEGKELASIKSEAIERFGEYVT